MRIFEKILFFKATNNTKTNIPYLSVAIWILAKGSGHKTDLLRTPAVNYVSNHSAFRLSAM